MQSSPSASPLAEAARLFAEGRFGEGEHLIDRVLAGRPRDKALCFEAAVLAERAGADLCAAVIYERLLRLDRALLPAWMNLGSLRLRTEGIDAALRCFRTAARLAPRLPDAAIGIGYAQLRAGRPADAVLAFARAVSLDPARADALANLGAAQLKAGDLPAALDALRRATRLRPEDPDLACSLGIAELQAGNASAAAAILDRVLSRLPGHARVLGARAAAAVRLNERDTAASLLDAEALLRRHAVAAADHAGDLPFNAALAAAVEAHPSLIRDRAGKTTRNGGQTCNLAQDSSPALRRLVAEVEGRISVYLTEQGDAAEPWRLNIWATVLDREGHQATHNHPGGIVSGVYYVRVPEQAGAADAGCIEFGRPPPEFDAAADGFARIVRPEEGAMLLFPSHLWHRTIPSVSGTPRISIAFDAVPLG